MKNYYVYILSSRNNNALYIGVTSDLIKRVYQHKNKEIKGHTQKYNIDKLVYFEIHQSIEVAITREKQFKAGSRKKKVELINQNNASWQDLYKEIL